MSDRVYGKKKYEDAYRTWLSSLCGTDTGQDVLRGKTQWQLTDLFHRCTGIVMKPSKPKSNGS